jgi:hypothetical protein
VSEIKYLEAILRIKEAPSRVRNAFYRHVVWVVFSILVLFLISQLNLMPRINVVILIGMFVGIFIAKIENLYYLRYLLRHIDAESLKKRISQ